MPLERYREKRNFTSTPEPEGGERPPSRGGSLFFCVQKHLASHLHYDFRLEHAGVLLSWAVPKGPSLDPAVRRMAAHVEDHPLEYGDFEGVIPEGYGAGIVLLWDVGTWEPEVADVDAALAKGDLKFRLNGYKLKGSWVLVRTRGGPAAAGGESRSWLLIKHRDEWSGELDVAEAFPNSVKSGGDFADILATGQPEIWLSNRPARGGQAGEMFERIIARALEMKGRKPAATRAKAATRSAGSARPARKPASKRGAAADKTPKGARTGKRGVKR